MNKFRFKLSATVITLFILIIIISIVGIVWNIYNISEYKKLGEFGISKIISFILIIIIALLAIIFATSALIYSNYVIKEKTLYVYIGIIRTKISILDITEITYYKKSEKLVLYFINNKFTVAVINKDINEDFVLALRKVNPEIIYNNKMDNSENI